MFSFSNRITLVTRAVLLRHGYNRHDRFQQNATKFDQMPHMIGISNRENPKTVSLSSIYH